MKGYGTRFHTVEHINHSKKNFNFRFNHMWVRVSESTVSKTMLRFNRMSSRCAAIFSSSIPWGGHAKYRAFLVSGAIEVLLAGP